MEKKNSVFKSLKNIFKKNEETKIIDELTKSYHKRKERGDEHPIDATIEQIMEIIKNSQNPDETAQKIITAAIDANAMPNRIPEKLSIIISEDDELNDEIISKAVEETISDVPNEMIDTIIEEGSLGEKDRLRLIKNTDDKNLITKRVNKEFDDLYKKCKEIKDHEVVERLNYLIQFVRDNKIEIDINSKIVDIVSKKMAENYYCDEIKGTTLYRLSKSIPVLAMYEINIAKKVEDEYLKLEKQRGKKEEGRFSREELDLSILKEIAKDVGYRYRTTGRFTIPESKRLHSITNGAEKEFIEQVGIAANIANLSEKDIQIIERQLKGTKRIEEEKEYNLIKSITQMEDKSEYLDLLYKIINNENERKTLKTISDAGIIENLRLLDEEKRKIAIDKIADVLDKKVISKTESKDISNNNIAFENKDISNDDDIEK